MATLVLTVVGSAIGGPIGGAIGAILGQQIDQNILFRPKGREGPRLQELAIQTSSYGTQVPRIFGKMRVAGTVIWGTDLKEAKNTQGGGKGKPKTTTFSYSASLAVALSSRETDRIGRIWADGKIFRGSAGDFKTSTGFRFYSGTEDQNVDSLIASAEGSGATPAHRGLAIAVFEDMELAEYGNRIPSLTFEVIAEDRTVSLAEIIMDVSDGAISSTLDQSLQGFAASGEDRRSALASLVDNYPISVATDADGTSAISRLIEQGETVLLSSDDVVLVVDGTRTSRPEDRTLPETKLPRQISLRYYDPDRDYQSGMQNVFRPGQSRSIMNQDFPATISADEAKAISHAKLWSVYQERSTIGLHILLSENEITPGALVAFDNESTFWRVRTCEIKNGAIDVSLSRASSSINITGQSTDEGRSVSETDALAGPTRLALVDLPFAIGAFGQVSDIPRLYAVAAGDLGWRNAQLFSNGADQNANEPIADIPAPAIIGEATQVLGSSSAQIFDHMNKVEITLHSQNMALNHADEAQLVAGNNIAILGAEIIQFSSAMPLGNKRYRLSGLIRGLGGTETEIAGHVSGEQFTLLEAATMAEIDPAYYTPFQPATFWALGRGDEEPVNAIHASPGVALKPWSPVHPKVTDQANGDVEIRWTRRSRAGSIWRDNVDVPIAEETELYRLVITSDYLEAEIFSIDVPSPAYNITADRITDHQSGGGSSVLAEIRQVGDHGLSEPLAVLIPI